MIKRKLSAALTKEIQSDKVIVLTGMRRTGKTTLVRSLYGAATNTRKVFLDLENPLNQSYFSSLDYDAIKSLLDRIAVGSAKKLLVVLDEIQNVRSLPSVVKYLSDHYPIKFVLTGSASFYLKNLFAESLSGRKRIFELYPLDFEEFLSHKAPQIKKPALGERVTPAVFHLLEKYVAEYLLYGGFPSVVLQPSHEEKLRELEDIFSSYYQKEVLFLSDFRKLDVMKAVIAMMLTRPGNKLDLSKIAAETGATRATVREYLDFLESTYFIKRIRPYSKSADVSLRGQQKLYIVDNGFLAMKQDISAGQVFENGIYNLLRTHGDVFFYQTKGGAEIDFIIKKDTEISAFEIKTTVRSGDIYKLRKLSEKLSIRKYYLISKTYVPYAQTLFPCQL